MYESVITDDPNFRLTAAFKGIVFNEHFYAK
jgi:hypothetical protein